MKTAIVTTTINIPTFLEDICENAHEYNHNELGIIIIGDKKTPHEITIFVDNLYTKYNIQIDMYIYIFFQIYVCICQYIYIYIYPRYQ